MSDPSMRVICDPPLEAWPLGSGSPDAEGEGTSKGAGSKAGDEPIIATGHQAWLWHPGIFAKDIAAVAAAQRFAGKALHLVVDSDVHNALSIDLPVVENERLDTVTLQMAELDLNVPTGAQPAVDADAVIERIKATERRLGATLAVELDRLIEAWTDLPDEASLARQVGIVQQRLMARYLGEIPLVFVSDFPSGETAEAWGAVVRRMIEEAERCVRAYNEASRAVPAAGLTRLRMERERIELPLWRIVWGEARRRVFADIADASPLLVDERGEMISRDDWTQLAPRALLLSAFMRSEVADLFIHGKGGGVYDEATEHWWHAWRGEALGPKAVVSADLHLPLDVPVADRAAVDRAVWYAHHLPHNVDRYLNVEGEDVERKRWLLEHMNDDRDGARRAAAFAEVHAINDRLTAEHADTIAAARSDVATTRAGLANRRLAGKRDWSFCLYPEARLRQLVEAICPACPDAMTAARE